MQRNSTPSTRYEVVTRPGLKDEYVQRIEMWKAVQRLGSTNRGQLLRELQRIGYERPKGGALDEAYCRIELTDMTKRGFLRRLY